MGHGTRSAAARHPRLRDVGLLLVVPLITIGVFAFPEPLRREFTFYYLDPSPVTAFTAHFVHLSVSHLVANVLGFLILGSTAYLLYTFANRRRFFLIAFTSTIIGLPIPLSYLNLVSPRNAIGFGLSGLVMAQLGLIPVGLVLFASERNDLDWDHRTVLGPFLFSIAAIGALLVPIKWLIVSISIAASTGLVHVDAETSDRSLRSTVGKLVELLTTADYAMLFFVGSMLWIGIPVIAFGRTPTVDGASMHHFVHLMGYTIPFLVAILSLELVGLSNQW